MPLLTTLHQATDLLGVGVIVDVENHQNFAWREVYNRQETIVHHERTTAAGREVRDMIPGSMADLTYVVRGFGNAASLNSAAHRAGRMMSRR